MTKKEFIDKVYDYLIKNELFYEPYFTGVKINGKQVIAIEVEWGDWKHEHLYLDHVMAKFGNVQHLTTENTETDGSDCYTARHYYIVNVDIK